MVARENLQFAVRAEKGLFCQFNIAATYNLRHPTTAGAAIAPFCQLFTCMSAMSHTCQRFHLDFTYYPPSCQRFHPAQLTEAFALSRHYRRASVSAFSVQEYAENALYFILLYHTILCVLRSMP
jgi:hypothetical protein